MIDYPEEVITENQKAWYLRHFHGMTYKEIGNELNYTDIRNKYFVVDRLYSRQSIATIYAKQQDYCKNICTDSVADCRQCNLYKFMLNKMLKEE